MLEAFGAQVPDVVLFSDLHRTWLIGNLADSGNRRAVDFLWQASNILGCDGEQEFEVFATMQGQCQGIEGAATAKVAHVFIERTGRGINYCSDVALFAQVSEIGREAVAQVDHCRGELLLSQDYAPAGAWLWAELAEQEGLDGFVVGVFIRTGLCRSRA